MTPHKRDLKINIKGSLLCYNIGQYISFGGKDMEDEKRVKYGKMASVIGICCNVFLAVSKLIVGLMSGMISIIADGINNLSDSISSIVSLIGFNLSSKPADDDHPFGHARYEYISGLIVAFLVMIAAVELFRSSFIKIIHPSKINYSLPMYIVLAGSILVKLFMYVIYKSVGKKIDSTTMIAVSTDSRNDIFATLAVLISALLCYYFGVNIDGITGTLVAIIIMISGIGLVKDTLNPLVGPTPDPEFVASIKNTILSYDGVLGTHDLMVHDYGPGHRFASAHVEVPAEKGIIECHEIVDRIERDLLEDYKLPVLIHYDPIMTLDEHQHPVYRFLKKEAKNINENISIHDFRVVDAPSGAKTTMVIFDCEVPKGVAISDDEVNERFSKALKENFPEYEAAITIDHGYVAVNRK